MIGVLMGNSKQYTDEFRAEAMKQVIERGLPVVDAASRIGDSQAHAVRLGAGGQEGGSSTGLRPRAERLGRDSPAQGRAKAGDRGARHPKIKPPRSLPWQRKELRSCSLPRAF